MRDYERHYRFLLTHLAHRMRKRRLNSPLVRYIWIQIIILFMYKGFCILDQLNAYLFMTDKNNMIGWWVKEMNFSLFIIHSFRLSLLVQWQWKTEQNIVKCGCVRKVITSPLWHYWFVIISSWRFVNEVNLKLILN